MKMKLLLFQLYMNYKLYLEPKKKGNYIVKLKQYCDGDLFNSTNAHLEVKGKERKVIILSECIDLKETEYQIYIPDLPKFTDIKFNKCLKSKHNLKSFFNPYQYGTYQLGPINCLLNNNLIKCHHSSEKLIKIGNLVGTYESKKEFQLKILLVCKGGENQLIKYKFKKIKNYSDQLLLNEENREFNIELKCYDGIKTIMFNSNTNFKFVKINFLSIHSFNLINNLDIKSKFYIHCEIDDQGLPECRIF